MTQVIVKQMDIDTVWNLFKDIPLPYYHDASPDECKLSFCISFVGDFHLTVRDCVEGLKIAIDKGSVDWIHFDASAYEYYERVENGDLNWVVKDRIIAFSGPHVFPEEVNGVRTMTPEEYLKVFADLHVGVAVRLNKPAYDRKVFTENGIKHYDIYFPDGGLPECTLCLSHY